MGGKENQDEISVVDLFAGQAVIKNQISNMQADVETKHRENRGSIHKLRNDIQDVSNEVWKLKIKIAGYSAIGGAIAAAVGHYLDKLLK